MGIGQKIKDALHHDSPPKSSTYENDKPPGSFPSETTNPKHTNLTDGRDYTTTGNTTGTTGTSGLTGKDTTTTTGTGRHSPTSNLTGNTHGGATGDITGKTHRTTDSGIDVGHGHNRTGEQDTQNPYWGSMGCESHGVIGSADSSGLTGSNARAGYNDPAGTHGPHGNRAENLADPRVDYDRDHRGAPGTGLTGSNVHNSNVRTGYDDPSGTHGPHNTRTGNLADPRVDSDRDHRGAPGTGLSGTTHGATHGTHGTHGTSGLSNSNFRTGYDDPEGTHGPHSGRVANAVDPRVDSDRDHRGAPYGANKDLPLRPNEQYGANDRLRGQGPEAVGGGVYNPNVPAGHHDPTSNVDRSIEGSHFTHTGHAGNAGPGAQTQHATHTNPSLIGAHSNDPYDTRMRDRDMGYERSGHGIAGGVAGAGLGAAATEASRRHHHDDIRESGYGANTTRSGVDDYSRTSGSGLTGHEPGVPRTTMLDPYNESPTTHGVGADKGIVGGRNGSPPFNQGSLQSSIPSGMGPDHYGPGHEGAKVMHTCSHCGNDNDISRYFKKDAVYRMN
ncbi:hypothetical protein KNSL1_001800 [Colletotrichum chrysophilum]|nr:hypothetical protein KNSL1_001800 [Colletotrichum chrysophilum]